MLTSLYRRFETALRDCSIASARSMAITGTVGAIIFAGYAILWLYVTPVEHESLGLRGIAVLLCLAVALSPRWPERYRHLLPWTWFIAVMYALPFYATYQLLGSNYSILRSMLEVSMVFFVIVIFPHYLLALTNMALGIGLGVLAGYLTIPYFDTLNHDIVKSVHLQAMIYSVGAGLLFTRSNMRSMLARQRVDALKDLAASIAHELRNPLGQLRNRLDSISRILPAPTTGGQHLTMPAREVDTVYEELAQGKLAIERGMQVIAMTLDEINARPLDTSNLRYVSAATATRKAVDEFGYDGSADRARVALHIAQDFVFKGDETRYVFLLFNLLKNAIHYFQAYPAAHITITVDRSCVTFEDTGPGIQPDVLARLFESFHTSGKAGGTGLGLSYCKRTMVAFGGDIRCESQPNRFTRFELRFPEVALAELAAHEAHVLARARQIFSGKRLLVVDDVPALRKTARSLLAPLNAEIVEAENGQQALELLAASPFDAMVLDLSMPVLDGYATADSIRGGRVAGMSRLPIVAFTTESTHVARAKLERVGVDALVNKPCSPVELIEALCRAHELARSASDTALAAESLAGKTILIADDDGLNRRYLRAMLEKHRIKVMEASDGVSALNLLEALNAHGVDAVESVDAIVTDIHMPALDGIGLAQAVQAAALTPRPVLIALSARDDEAMVAKAIGAGISDFVSKPVEATRLFETLARHLATAEEPAPATAPAQAPARAEVPAQDLLNHKHLETLRSVGILEKVLPEALKSTRGQIDQLQEPVARRDVDTTRQLLHSLIGVCGNMGSHALHQRLRAMYALLVEHHEWPGAGWHDELVALHARTALAVREGYLQQG